MTAINGLYFIENVLTNEQSAQIIQQLDDDQDNKWVPLSANAQNNASRVVKHFGYKYGYVSYKINEPAPPMPPYIAALRDILTDKWKELKLFDNLKDKDFVFNQCIVNNYNAGQGISAHIDLTKFGEIIGCFTLGSGAIMKFKNTNKDEIWNNRYMPYREMVPGVKQDRSQDFSIRVSKRLTGRSSGK